MIKLHKLFFIWLFLLALSVPKAYSAPFTANVTPNKLNYLSLNVLLNFTISNTDTSKNITRVNITFPSGFTFVSNSNSTTTSNWTFSSSTSSANWTNATTTGIVRYGQTQYFSLNVNVADAGTYNFTITTLDNSSILNSTNATVSVNRLTIAVNATQFRRGDLINITINSTSIPTVNITKPNGNVTLLTTPVSKANNFYETNYTFLSSDPVGSYMVGANSSVNSTTTNVTMNSTITVTLESSKMSMTRKIVSRSGSNILIYGTMTYNSDNSACPSCAVTFTYDSTSAGSNTTNSAGSYNFSFSMANDGNYSFKVQASDNYNNSGSNATAMTIKTHPEYVKYRLSYALGTSKTNDVYKIGTSGNTSVLIDDSTLTNLQYSSNLTHGYVCSYDLTEYPDGLLISLIHSYKSSYLDYVNFSAVAGSSNYTLELRNKIDGSNMLLVYTKGTCENINDKMYLVEKQTLPSKSFATFSYGGPEQYPYEIRTEYDRIQINGTDRWTSGSHKLCIQKTGVSSANKPMVDVGRC
jgi:hypothetical protein